VRNGYTAARCRYRPCATCTLGLASLPQDDAGSLGGAEAFALATVAFTLLGMTFRSNSRRKPTLCVFVFLVSGILHAQTAPVPEISVPDAQQVIGFLNGSIDWYRGLVTEEQIANDPGDVLLAGDDRQNAMQAVRFAFDFARAVAQASSNGAASAGTSETGQTSSRFQTLTQLAARTDQQVTDTQNEMNGLRQKLPAARGKVLADIRATVDELQAELDLAKARSETIHEMLQFVATGSSSAAGSNLAAQIQQLQRSVPETASATPLATRSGEPAARAASAAANAQPAATTATPTRRQQPAGILALITDLFSLTRKIHAIDERLAQTDELARQSAALRTPLVQSMTSAIAQGDALAKEADTSSATALEQQKQQLDALTAQFRHISAMVLPLGQAVGRAGRVQEQPLALAGGRSQRL
jgi:hypothetical protein